jgi:hypothetical protein
VNEYTTVPSLSSKGDAMYPLVAVVKLLLLLPSFFLVVFIAYNKAVLTSDASCLVLKAALW